MDFIRKRDPKAPKPFEKSPNRASKESLPKQSSSNLRKGYTLTRGRKMRRNGLQRNENMLLPNDFYNRGDFVSGRREKMPQSTDAMLVVPAMYDGWGFIVDFYDQSFCEGVSEEEFKDAIRAVNKEIQSTLCKNRANEVKNMTGLHNYLLFTGLLVLVLGFGILMSTVMSDKKSLMMCYVGLGCFALVGLLSIGLYLSIFMFKQEEELPETEIYNKVSKILEDLNNTRFKQAGLAWKTKARFFWLELHKIKSSQQVPQSNHHEADEGDADSANENEN